MSRRLLLADDSVTIQKVIEIILSDKDYILRVASDGDEAMRMANNETPDLIMADVFMPGKNGYEVCEAVRSNPTLQAVPVLLLAGSFEPFDQDKAQAVGANGWIVKPFSSQVLVDKVEELLALVPVEEQWQGTPSVAPGDQDILQALDEVIAIQPTVAPSSSVVEPVFEQPVDFEPEQFEPSVEVEPVAPAVALEPFNFTEEEEVSKPAVSVDPFAATAQPIVPAEQATSEEVQELEPFVGFDVPDEAESAAQVESELLGEPEPFTVAEPIFTAPASSESVSFVAEEKLAPTELGEHFADFSFNEEPELAPMPEPTAAEPEADFSTFSFDTEPEPAVVAEVPAVAEPLTDLPPLEEFQAVELVTEPATELSAVPEAAVAPEFTDNVLELREEDIVAEGAYASEPARVETRVAFLSDEQLTEIVERVAGAVIERLATPLLEQVIWEVVPDLAESMVREEMVKIKSDA